MSSWQIKSCEIFLYFQKWLQSFSHFRIMCMYDLIMVIFFCLFSPFWIFHDRQIQLETTLTHVEDTLSRKTTDITHSLQLYQVKGIPCDCLILLAITFWNEISQEGTNLNHGTISAGAANGQTSELINRCAIFFKMFWKICNYADYHFTRILQWTTAAETRALPGNSERNTVGSPGNKPGLHW